MEKASKREAQGKWGLSSSFNWKSSNWMLLRL